MGLYETENISNGNICTIAINPKENLKNFKIEPSTKNISVWDEILKEWILKVMLEE